MNIRQIICLCFAFSSCAGFQVSDITVTAPKNAPVQAEDIRNVLLAELPIESGSDKNLEITVYDCSRGKERLTYNKDGTVTTTVQSGYMKLLCAVKKENNIIEAIFIDVSGGADDMIADLTGELKKILR